MTIYLLYSIKEARFHAPRSRVEQEEDHEEESLEEYQEEEIEEEVKERVSCSTQEDSDK